MRSSYSRQEAGSSYQFGGGARETEYVRTKSANNVSPARYVVEQRIAYRPEQAVQVREVTRTSGGYAGGYTTGNTGYSSSVVSRENYGPGERRGSPLRKEFVPYSNTNERESNKQFVQNGESSTMQVVQEDARDNKQEGEKRVTKVQFAEKEVVDKK